MVYTIPEKGVAIILYPDDEFSVSVHVDYNSKVIGNQYATFNPGDDFARKISPCRTFVFLHELEPLINMNLIKGGDLDNAIVVVENPVPDEQLDKLKKVFNKPDIEIKAGYLNNLELRCNNELRATSCSTCWATSAAGRTDQGPRLGHPPGTLRQHGVYEAAQADHPPRRRETPLHLRLP